MDRDAAREWIRRWDRQQERYLADREQRFTVIADVVAEVAKTNPAPVLLDLGCGPGSLTVRLAARFPDATLIGVDRDPVLLALARAAHDGVARFVDADLTAPGWTATAGLPGPVDVAVSTTALHWIAPDRLPGVYRDVAALLRPGGALVNGDNFHDEQPAVAGLAAAVLRARAERAGVTGNEDWRSWWDAAAADPALAPAMAERERRGSGGGSTGYSVRRHADLLHQAGFREVGTVWQAGDDTVLVAVR